MKTTRQNTRPEYDPALFDLLMTAIRGFGVIFAALAILLIILMTFGCRSQKKTAVVTRTAVTANMSSRRADSLRTQSEAQIRTLATTMGTDLRQTRIHIDRDSSGNATDITVDETSASRTRTASDSKAHSDSQTVAALQAETESSEESETTEAKPAKTDIHGVARTAVAWVFAVLFLLLGVSLMRRLRK